jgi:GT2 family glycosyltransferase
VDDVRAVAGDRLVVTTVDGPFHFSRSVNEGVRVARGQHVLLLNDDTEMLEPRALERMVGVLSDPTIGVVGAKLLFEDGRVQHLGVAVNDAWEPDHPFIRTADDGAHFGMGLLDLDWIAVTGACLLTERALFERVGGFSPDLPLNYNDVDYCLKVRREGLRVVATPFARWHHYESASRTPRLEQFERDFLRETWSAALYRDPFVNLRSVR